MKNNSKKINDVKKEMETLKENFDKDYKNLEEKLKKLEKGTYEIGDIANYKGFEWFVIKVEDNIATLMMKNKLSDEVLDKLGFEHDSYYDIKFNSDQRNNDWMDSNVRKCVNAFMEKYLDSNELYVMETNYDEDKYSEEFIRIPTKNEIENLPQEMRKINASSGYWTMTASYGVTDTSFYAVVFVVDSDGWLDNGYVNNTYGVRPVITLNTESLI